jgi:hypothetical protein
MFSIKTFQKDDYFTVANWTKKDPAFQKHSTWLQDAILKSLPEDYLATFKDRRKFEDNGFAMFNHLLTELTPTSLDNLILDVIELGRVCVVWALLVWPIFPAKSSPFPAKKYRPKPRPTPHFPMNPEHCPLFCPRPKSKLCQISGHTFNSACQTRADHRSVWTDIGRIQPTSQHNNCSTRLVEAIGTRGWLVFSL